MYGAVPNKRTTGTFEDMQQVQMLEPESKRTKAGDTGSDTDGRWSHT